MNEDEIKCPFCAEVIKAEAKICRFCNRNLKGPGQFKKVKEVQARSGVMDGVKLGCGMFIVLPLILLFGGVVFFSIGSCGKGAPKQGGSGRASLLYQIVHGQKIQPTNTGSGNSGTSFPLQTEADRKADRQYLKARQKYYGGGKSPAEIGRSGIDKVMGLGFVKEINCNPAPVVGDVKPAAFARIDHLKWGELERKQKLAAINLIGQFCGRLTFLNPDNNVSVGLGVWDPARGGEVFGPQ